MLFRSEMSSDDVIVRLVHRVTGINLVNTPFDTLDATLQEVVTKACSLIDSHIYLADSNGSMSVERLREILGTLPEVMDFIVVDTFSNMSEGMDWKVLEELANHLKEVAVDKLLGEPMVLIVSQVSEAQKDNTTTFIPNFMGVRGGKGLAYASSAMIGVCYNQALKTTTIAVIKPDRMVGSDFSEIQVQFSNGDYYEIQSSGVSQEVLQKEEAPESTYDY